MNAPTVEADRSDAGFTLVEMLVSLALLSVLTTLLFGNVSVGLKVFQSGSAHADHAEHGMITQSLLRRMIRDAYPFFLSDGQGHSHVDFEGARESIGFLGNAPNVIGGGGRHRFNLFVDRHRNKSDLVLTSTPELGNHYSELALVKTLAIGDVDWIQFSYFGAATAGQTAQWHDKWTQQNELPKLVRIRVAFRADDARSWPDLIIAPRISADASCTYDPVTTRCRGR
jgi:general secretion pathway protein J